MVSVTHTATGEYLVGVVFVVALLTLLSVSCAYSLWPILPDKWVLRCLDHAGIYLLIAGTHRPFLVQLADRVTTGWMAVIVWSEALAGMVIKLFLPSRIDRLAITFYLAMGVSSVVILQPLTATLPTATQ